MRAYVVVLTLMVSAFSAVPALAQSSNVTWGVQGDAGVGYGTVPKDSGTTREMKGAYSAGVFAVLPLAGSFKFQPEFRYDHREIVIGGIPTKMSYFGVPLLARNEFLGIFMVQGVALNFVNSADVFGVDFKDALTSPDAAIVLGVGKRAGRVSVEGRWETGFRSFQKGINAGGVHMRTITGVLSVYLK